ncbi:unnamed protein product [Cylindrotheca closterium]|uniref:Uncharacterized protein n=1 Tax=Cylindrotheca closterium TaxID=2856 RepID=A0AAD2G4X1_9STRA|nr:unnamed protein product [Cylindrotheca closterium]
MQNIFVAPALIWFGIQPAIIRRRRLSNCKLIKPSLRRIHQAEEKWRRSRLIKPSLRTIHPAEVKWCRSTRLSIKPSLKRIDPEEKKWCPSR